MLMSKNVNNDVSKDSPIVPSDTLLEVKGNASGYLKNSLPASSLSTFATRRKLHFRLLLCKPPTGLRILLFRSLQEGGQG